MQHGRGRGFTLVEMIVAVAITAFVGAAIFTTFAQGLRLWARATQDRGVWKIDLWGERLTEDLWNAFRDSRWIFRGTRTELFFASLRHEGGEALSKPVPVFFHYRFDSSAGAVVSRQYAFEEMLAAAQKPLKTSEALLERVVFFELEFYGYDAKAKDYRWFSQWNKDCFPETVKITIETKPMNHRKWVRMIQMPTGGACPE